MKKPSKCAVFFALLVGLVLFFEIKDTITGDKPFFLTRLLYSKRAYAKKIEVKAYLLNDQQVLESFAHPQIELHQPKRKELFLKNVNVVLRIKNHGYAPAWGTLAYSIDHTNWQKIDVILDPANSRNNVPFYEYVIPIGIGVSHDDDVPQKPVICRWVHLYVKI